MKHFFLHFPFCLISCTLIHILDYKFHMMGEIIMFLARHGVL